MAIWRIAYLCYQRHATKPAIFSSLLSHQERITFFERFKSSVISNIPEYLLSSNKFIHTCSVKEPNECLLLVPKERKEGFSIFRKVKTDRKVDYRIFGLSVFKVKRYNYKIIGEINKRR